MVPPIAAETDVIEGSYHPRRSEPTNFLIPRFELWTRRRCEASFHALPIAATARSYLSGNESTHQEKRHGSAITANNRSARLNDAWEEHLGTPLDDLIRRAKATARKSFAALPSQAA